LILFITNADSEVLCTRAVQESLPSQVGGVRCVNPARLAPGEEVDLDGTRLVLMRLLGGRSAFEGGFDRIREACLTGGVPFIALGGEAHLDLALAELSSVDDEIVRLAHSYLAFGGPPNFEGLFCYLSNKLLGTDLSCSPPTAVPACGVLDEPRISEGRPTVVVVFYRAQFVAGDVWPIRSLASAIEALGGNAVSVYCYSLRGEVGEQAVELIASLGPDCVVTTVWAAGGTQAGGEGWEPGCLASLGVPVVQAIAATSSSSQWQASSLGLQPADVAMSVAIPEFDGRIVGVPFAFKEVVDDGSPTGSEVVAYRAQPDRVERVAAIALSQARLRKRPQADKRVAMVLSAYPTKRSRIGNAVGLDTPASAVRLLEEMASRGYRVGPIPSCGDELMSLLADRMAYDPSLAVGAGTSVAGLDISSYVDWFATLPKEVREVVVEAWGEPPGELFVDKGSFVFAGVDLGQVFVAVQPPRGFGENPVAVYHSPDLPPTHHYLAFYRWLSAPREQGGFEADAVVHLGKHGTLEWLPGKGIGLSSGCFPDVTLGSVPLVYPFVVNDPGEGAQAKRRAHAVVVDHLVPPMVRADSYGDLAEIESLLDEHARVLALDPTKLPAVRRKLWDALVAAEIHRDLGLDAGGPGEDFTCDDFDDIVGQVDGYLCELKDAQIRGGLHVLGAPPEGQSLVDMVLAITRVPQGRVSSLRQEVAGELAIELESASMAEMDRLEAECKRRVEQLASRSWTPAPGDSEVMCWIGDSLVPALRACSGEVDAVLGALEGRFVPPGPSGAPTRGMAHVLPTGRNFYTIDPRAVPSPLSYETGSALAEGVVQRYLAEEGRFPVSVAIVVWGTATMRTAGDDIAQALALLGVRPVWEESSGRVRVIEVVDLDRLGRPRVGVTLRISGFFRDAFSHLIDTFERAIREVARLDEPDAMNPLAAERRRGGDLDARVFGPMPGGYGSGILPLIDTGEWEGDADLAEVYLTWGGWAYSGSGEPREAREEAERRLGAVEVAIKNQDNREHDIFDSDDYLQDHGGMVAAIRHLSGRSPKAYFGDSSDPSRPKVRDLKEEAARVVRSRVLNPKWIAAMVSHGYKGAFEIAATVDYFFGYDATASVAEDWMYEAVTRAYVADPDMVEFFRRSNPQALLSIAERLLEASQREMWSASEEALDVLREAILEAEGWMESGQR